MATKSGKKEICRPAKVNCTLKGRPMKTKVRTEYLVIEQEELQRILDQNLGSVTFKAEVHHSRIVLTAWTGEDEQVNAYQLK